MRARIDIRKIQPTYRVVRPGPVSDRRTPAPTVKKKGKPFHLPRDRPKAKEG